MSSILEALRELESNRAPAPERTATPILPPPTPPPQGIGLFMQAMAGLAVGGFVFGGYLLAQRWVIPAGGGAPAASASPFTSSAASAPAASADRPAWLDHAEAPKARVDRTQAEPARRTDTTGGGPQADRVEPPAAAEPRPSRPARQLEVESINHSGVVSQRSATLRINGRRVTLGQRESADGVEVQLITPDGVYVQRGGDVFLVTPSR
jgi:hypothetical protein